MMFDPKMLQVYLVGGTQDVHNDVVKFFEKVELAMKSGASNEEWYHCLPISRKGKLEVTA